ncbi:HAD domain-containing protein [Pseudarthrobacter sulfonivorans]|uniref:HAD domain-containing protein n=1 Tax=Pseudarthrobacter sulfonivorans TaxID=121292 RepID=UPI0027E2C9CB|nr:HAD domain-containing protein [Pseudarthrobacter sulfonivorans]
MLNVTLYLDVDGVVCPFGATGTTPWGSAWSLANAGMLEVAYAGELVAGLNGLARLPGLRCVWLTSWEDMAPRYLCPAVGLDGRQWPWLTAESGTGEGWWKLAALQEDVATTAPAGIVWIDDQLRYEPDAQAWAAILGARILAVSPDPRRGISPAELAAVSAFVAAPVF